MDFIKNVAGSVSNKQGAKTDTESHVKDQQHSAGSNVRDNVENVAQGGNTKDATSTGGGGIFGKFGNQMNEMAGGGKKAEANEDYLDKYVYPSFLCF